MIYINKTKQEGHRYHFPTIDFKFQNTDNVTAFLSQFTISVLSSHIDRTPVLDFVGEVENGILKIILANNGWGDAVDCNVELKEPILNRLFSDLGRRYKGTVKSGAEKGIIQLSPYFISSKQLKAISKKSVVIDRLNITPSPLIRQDSFPEEGVILNPSVRWECQDENGTTHRQNEESIRFNPPNSIVAITSSGFVKLLPSLWCLVAAQSDVTYITVIDPLQGRHNRKYAISRKVPPGDVERFHIMIGSPTSCRLCLQFSFLINKTEEIHSEEFELDIWNPKNTEWHLAYQDGDKLNRIMKVE